jgi:hypothetical protein
VEASGFGLNEAAAGLGANGDGEDAGSGGLGRQCRIEMPLVGL